MTDVQKLALKEVLHLLVEKEELPLLKELVAKLPPTYANIVEGILDVGAPALIAAQVKIIDEQLA